MDKLSPIKVGIALALLVIVNPAKSDGMFILYILFIYLFLFNTRETKVN